MYLVIFTLVPKFQLGNPALEAQLPDDLNPESP
jgi:hypothetical protein